MTVAVQTSAYFKVFSPCSNDTSGEVLNAKFISATLNEPEVPATQIIIQYKAKRLQDSSHHKKFVLMKISRTEPTLWTFFYSDNTLYKQHK